MTAQPVKRLSDNAVTVYAVNNSERTLADVTPEKGMADDLQTDHPPAQAVQRGLAFWMVIVTVCMCTCIAALELNCISTALPTIVSELQGSGYVWVASSYALASTASLSFGGDMAEAFGRQPAMLMSLVIFALGSGLSGAARTIEWLIAARTVQGFGAGGLIAISPIMMADIVPLKDRGLYQGFVALVYAVFSAVGPFLGGVIAQTGQWRWLFYMSLPISGICILLVITSVKLQIPKGTVAEKLGRMDWIGCFLIMGGSTACSIALTWSGVQYSWRSPQVLVPLILGMVALFITIAFGKLFSKRPIVPLNLLSNRTSFSGYAHDSAHSRLVPRRDSHPAHLNPVWVRDEHIQATDTQSGIRRYVQIFLAPIILYTVVYYVPLYFQACKDASPMRSGVDTLGLSVSSGPIAITMGISVAYFKKYRPQCYIAWSMYVIGSGLMSVVHANSSLGPTIVYSVIATGGGSALYAVTDFPVLAPLPVTDNGRAITFLMFVRTFATAWGITIGGTVVQNQLQKRLPPELAINAASFAYDVVPHIKDMPEPLKTQVRVAFADSITVLWQTMIGIAAIGFLSCFLMKEVPMQSDLDENWGLEESAKPKPSDSS